MGAPSGERRARLGRPVHPAGHERVRPRGGAADSDRGIRCWERMGHSRWHGAVSSAQVSRFRAMPVGDRRSSPRARSAASAKAGSGAGFALPRDAGRRPALRPSPRSFRGFGKGRKRCRFRAPARCRSETGAPAVPAIVPRLRQRQEVVQVSRSRAMPVGDRRSGRPRARSAASVKAGSGAGFALPRDAGRRPALQPSPLSFRGFGKGRKRRRFRAPARCRSETGAPVPALVPRLRQRQEVVQVSRSRAMPVGDRRSGRPRVRSAASAKAGSGAGFALPRDAGRRPALQPSPRSFRGFGKGRKWCRFRAPARCRSETGAPAVPALVPRLR